MTIVAIGKQVHTALKAADILKTRGVETEVIDPRTLSPLDEETILSSVSKTGRLIVIDEANPRCSAAADISALVADKGFDYLDGPIKLITAPHCPVPFSPALEDLYLPTPEKVLKAAAEIIGDEAIVTA